MNQESTLNKSRGPLDKAPPLLTSSEALAAVEKLGFQLRILADPTKEFGLLSSKPVQWYLLLPGESKYNHGADSVNYLGFFSNLRAILYEVASILNKEIQPPSVGEQQQFAAQSLLENYKFHQPAKHVGKWFTTYDFLSCAIDLDSDTPSQKKLFFTVKFANMGTTVTSFGSFYSK